MTKIQPVVFPLNLGTANCFIINISANNSVTGAVINYTLLDDIVTPPKRLSNGIFKLTEEQFTNHGNDKAWIENYVANQLGVIIVN